MRHCGLLFWWDAGRVLRRERLGGMLSCGSSGVREMEESGDVNLRSDYNFLRGFRERLMCIEEIYIRTF